MLLMWEILYYNNSNPWSEIDSSTLKHQLFLYSQLSDEYTILRNTDHTYDGSHSYIWTTIIGVYTYTHHIQTYLCVYMYAYMHLTAIYNPRYHLSSLNNVAPMYAHASFQEKKQQTAIQLWWLWAIAKTNMTT